MHKTLKVITLIWTYFPSFLYLRLLLKKKGNLGARSFHVGKPDAQPTFERVQLLWSNFLAPFETWRLNCSGVSVLLLIHIMWTQLCEMHTSKPSLWTGHFYQPLCICLSIISAALCENVSSNMRKMHRFRFIPAHAQSLIRASAHHLCLP